MVFRPKVLIVVDEGKGVVLESTYTFCLDTFMINFNTAVYIVLIDYWLCNIIYFILRTRKGCGKVVFLPKLITEISKVIKIK